MVKLGDVVVLCDKPSDAKLFKHFQRFSKCLKEITQIEVLPSLSDLPAEYLEGMAPLLQFDRADYYFCYNGRPFLVVEMTVHGYTGDNCLQRFARIAKTAEENIPFIYFAPFARTRFDELDRDNPSYRNVSADLYKGFVRLMEIFTNPVVALEWRTNNHGIPLNLANVDPEISGLNELLSLIESLLTTKLEDMIEKRSVINAPFLLSHKDRTIKLSERANVNASEVKIPNVEYEAILKACHDPVNSFEIIPREYFLRGKTSKLLTLMCINESKINKLILPNNRVYTFENLEKLRSLLPDKLKEKGWLFHHSGYQWRSEPNVGIVTNLDINMCRSKEGKTVRDREQFLAVHWPRVFYDKSSRKRKELLDKLENLEEQPEFQKLRIEKESFQNKKSSGTKFIKSSNKAIGGWNEKATVARVYRDTCDIIILNDAIILGNMWGSNN